MTERVEELELEKENELDRIALLELRDKEYSLEPYQKERRMRWKK